MNVRIQSLIAEVEALPEDDQNDLADMLEVFLAQRGEAADFTPEELAHLDRLAAGPRTLADPEEVAAFFAGRG